MLRFIMCDWRGEVMNEVIFRINEYTSLWNAPGNNTSYLALIGLNIEIFSMFCCLGVIYAKFLPKDKN